MVGDKLRDGPLVRLRRFLKPIDAWVRVDAALDFANYFVDVALDERVDLLVEVADFGQIDAVFVGLLADLLDDFLLFLCLGSAFALWGVDDWAGFFGTLFWLGLWIEFLVISAAFGVELLRSGFAFGLEASLISTRQFVFIRCIYLAESVRWIIIITRSTPIVTCP